MFGFIDEMTSRFATHYSADLNQLDTDTDQAVASHLRGLGETQLQDLLKTLRARRGLLDTSAAYSNEVVNISKQLLVFGGAGLGLVAAFAKDIAAFPQSLLEIVGLGALLYLDLILLSLFTLLLFLWQSRFRYPFLYFRKIGNTVPFFYYQATSHSIPRGFFQSAEDKLNAAELYAHDLTAFTSYMIGSIHDTEEPKGAAQPGKDNLSGLRVTVRDELQQYFLLLAYQGYVNQYEVRITNYFIYGLIGSFVAVLLVAIWFVIT